MLYIPCVELQFCIYYVQLPFEKWLPEIFKEGARLWQGGANAPPPPPPPPPLNETLLL